MESESNQGRHVFKTSWLSGDWQELNPIQVPRFGHACGKFHLQNGTQVVIVAGGKTGSNSASKIRHIEMLNLEVLLE